MEKETKYLFITLSIRDGEREHTHRVLHTTKCKNIDFAAEYYAAHFWGESELCDGAWYAWGGEIAIKLDSVKQITYPEYQYLNELFTIKTIAMKKFYYVVEKQLDSTDESINGLKTITIYKIDNDTPIRLGDIEVDLESYGEEEIEDFLSSNDYIDAFENVSIIQL